MYEKKAERLTKAMKDQIEKVRRSGKANMLDTAAVQYVANSMSFYDLTCYLIEGVNRRCYINYILTGEEPEKSEEE
jgi:hypothetical protein